MPLVPGGDNSDMPFAWHKFFADAKSTRFCKEEWLEQICLVIFGVAGISHICYECYDYKF